MPVIERWLVVPVTERSRSEPKCISYSSVLRTEIHQIKSNPSKNLLFDLCLFVWFLAKRLILYAGHWVFGHWAKSKWTEMYFLFKCPADRNTSNTIKSFCLICIDLFDFSRSDSWIPVTERWLVSVVEPSRSERRHKPKHHAQKHVRERHVFKLFLLILWL